MMPTAAKLVAGIGFAGVFAAASYLGEPLFLANAIPAPRHFLPVNAVLAFVVGWQVLGGRASRRDGGSVAAGLSHGLTTLVVAVFWVLLVHGAVRMIEYALRKRYDGVVDAVVDVMGRMQEFGRILASPDVVIVLVAGALATGVIAAFAGAKWR